MKLTDEHIVPFALEGIWLLPKSSCATCSAETSKFERICCRQFYGSFRTRENLRSRRKHPERVVAMRAYEPMEIPRQCAISTFPILRFHDQPGMLQVPSIEKDNWADILTLEVKNAPPERPLPPGISFGQSFDLDAFARMMAKIAHGFAVAVFGRDGFTSILNDRILGSQQNFPVVMGRSYAAPRADSVATALNWSVFDRDSQSILAITIHIFPGMGQPPIDVVVGSLSNDQRIAAEELARRESSTKAIGRK